MPPRVAKTGVAGSEETPSQTFIELLEKCGMEDKKEKPALRVERPVPPLDKDGKAPPALPLEEWTTWTWADYLKDVKAAAKAFVHLGFKPFDSVNIWGFNSPEWVMSVMAASFAGGKAAGLYPTDTAEAAAYKVVHSGGSIIVVEDKGKVEKLVKALDARGDAKKVRAIVAYGFEPKPGEMLKVKGCGNVPLLSWKALLELGSTKGSDQELAKRCAAVKPGHCAALIYTSGTTGDPKAVMISHDNFIAEVMAVLFVLKRSVGFGNGEEERGLSYLPLSHVAGCLLDIAAVLVATVTCNANMVAFFARPYDLKAGSLKDRMQVAKPTIFLGVPLVWEKIADKIRAIGASTTGVKKTVATWAKGLGSEYAKNNQLGGSGSTPFGYSFANDLVLSKIKEQLGLGECKFALTGAAPIRLDTLEYFGALGLQINEVYGMSECTGCCTVSTDEAHEWGSCGWELPGTEVRAFIVDEKDFNKKTACPLAPDIDSQEERFQGELCYRGRTIMMGYMAQPSMGAAHIKEVQKKTAEAIDGEGWLHSGDKGMITEKGLVKITGRYKELIIGEGGENIAPVPIEDFVKKTCDGVMECMMIGDKRKYNVALVTLKAVGANGETPGTNDLDAGAKRVNPDVTTISAAMDDETWIRVISEAIKAVNNNQKCCPNNSFKIQKFMILPHNFSEENNELTPTKKLKRKVVETAYKDAIDKMYKSDGMYVRY